MYALCVVQYCYRLLILPTFCTPCSQYIPAHLPVITFDINYHALAFLHFNIWLPCDRYTQPSSWFPLPGSVIIRLVGCGCVCWVANCRVYSHHRGGAKLRLIFIWTNTLATPLQWAYCNLNMLLHSDSFSKYLENAAKHPKLSEDVIKRKRCTVDHACIAATQSSHTF